MPLHYDIRIGNEPFILDIPLCQPHWDTTWDRYFGYNTKNDLPYLSYDQELKNEGINIYYNQICDDKPCRLCPILGKPLIADAIEVQDKWNEIADEVRDRISLQVDDEPF